MKLATFIIFVFVIFVTPLSAQEKIRLTNGEWPPYLSKNLPSYGYASHLVQKAFSAVGIEVEYGFFPWRRSFEYAKKGKISPHETWNGTILWVYTQERANDFLYSDVVIEDTEVLFSLKSSYIQWQTVYDLQGKNIGATLHTTYPIFEKAQDEGILKIQRAGNYNLLFQRLLSKRIDAVPYVKNVADFFMRTNLNDYERSLITYSPTIIEYRRYHLILTKHVSENERLLKLFNKGLKIIKENKIYEKLWTDFSQGKYDIPIN